MKLPLPAFCEMENVRRRHRVGISIRIGSHLGGAGSENAVLEKSELSGIIIKR